MRIERASAAGSVISAVLASACCIGPLLFAVLGISGAAAASRLEPARPYLLAVTFALLAAAFYFTYRPSPAVCGPDGECEMPRTNRAGKVLLWLSAAIVVLASTFPSYAEYLPL